jgi:type IV pilus assembly protein PilA
MRRSRGWSIREDGFSLIELLVVIAIIGILAGIALPIFWNQREKAYIIGLQAALKNAATSAESWQVSERPQSFADLDEQSTTALASEGFKYPNWAASPGYMRIEANDTEFCIEAQHSELSPSNEWRRSTYQSSVGRPQQSPDVCPEL